MHGRQIAFINVGVNSSHSHLKSPLFENNHYEFVPIPDAILKMTRNEYAVRYSDLKPSNGIPFENFIPSGFITEFVHSDPEFKQFTYGDYPDHSPRASNLKKLTIGDFLIFFSRLVRWKKGNFLERASFYLIAFFEIGKIIPKIYSKPESKIFKEIKENAHIIRAQCDHIFYDGFWIFKGTKRSRRFTKAIPFDRKTVEYFELVDRFEHMFNWKKFRSDNAVIGSYLRSIKVIEDPHKVDNILTYLNIKE